MVVGDRSDSMDAKLIGWAWAVKRRTRARGAVLWLFTDTRGPGPLEFARAAPRGLCGIVLRHDDTPGRAGLARALARACRARGVELTVAGDWRLARAVGAGLHLREGRPPAHAPRAWKLLTSSAHGEAGLRRARLSGALVFLSPAFPTASHSGARALGPLRWSRFAGRGTAALGGVTGQTIRRLPRAAAAGAVGALGLP